MRSETDVSILTCRYEVRNVTLVEGSESFGIGGVGPYLIEKIKEEGVRLSINLLQFDSYEGCVLQNLA